MCMKATTIQITSIETVDNIINFNLVVEVIEFPCIIRII